MVVNETAGTEVKVSLATRVIDWWMEHRVKVGTYSRIGIGLGALAAFIYILARSAAG